MLAQPSVRISFVFLLALSAIVSSSSAITITLDGRHDTFFRNNSTALAALQAAADDVSAAITGSLTAITADLFTGASAETRATLDWSFNYRNPTTNQIVTLTSPRIGANEVRLYYGARGLGSSTFGLGGGMGAGATFGAAGVHSPSNYQRAVNDANMRSEQHFMRGARAATEYVYRDLSLNGSYPAELNVFLGPAFGSLTFNSNTNWHYNHRTPVASGRRDLYSVALHEILHSLGFGDSPNWDILRSGTNWNGREVRDLMGSGSNLLASDGKHLRAGLMSTRISDGSRQEVAMDPTLSAGTRKELTALDLAFLRDLGYETVAGLLALEGDFNADGTVDAADYTVWRNGLGTTYTEADFRVWRSNLGATAGTGSSAAVAVPEPGALALLLVGMACAVVRRRR